MHSQSIIEGDVKSVIESFSDGSMQVNWEIWHVIDLVFSIPNVMFVFEWVSRDK